jgi:hypothetical protein
MTFIVSEQDGPPPEGYIDIWTPSFWHWGAMKRLVAAQYGYESFRLRVKAGGPRRIPPDRVGDRPKKTKKPRGRQPPKV